jgi:hypothetical protein
VAGDGLGQFNGPTGIETDCRGAVWVAENVNNRIQRLGEPGTALPPCRAPSSQNPLPVARDTLAPIVSGFSLSRKRFKVGRKATPVTAAEPSRRRRSAPRGSSFRFNLSERADVRILIEGGLAGRRVGKRCRKPTRKLRTRRKCTRFKRRGTLTRRSLSAGGNTIAFSGRIGRRPLRRGRYRAAITGIDAAGNRSKRLRASFRIVRR